MPRIPISDIPNAPKVVPQPTGGNLPGVNLGRAQTLLKQDLLPRGSLDSGKGLQALAAGISGAAGDLSRAALHVQNLVDEDMLFKGKYALSLGANGAREEIASKPEHYTEWGAITKRHLSNAYETFLKENPNLSSRARTLLEREYLSTESLLYGRAQAEGMEKLVRNVKGGKLLNAENLARFMDGPGAIEELREARDLGVLSELEFDLKGRELMKVSREEEHNALRFERPDLALEKTRDEKATPWLSPSERIAQERADLAALSTRDSEVTDDVSNWYFNGEVKTLDEVKERLGEYGAGYVHRNRADLERMLAKRKVSDEGAALEILHRMRLNGVPENEDDRRIAQGRVKRELSTVLNPGEFTELRASVDEFYNGKPRPHLDEQLDRWDADIIAMGGFGGGYDKKKADAGDVEEIEKRKNTFYNLSKARQAREDWRKKNPQASDDQVRQAYQDILTANGWMPAPKDDRWFFPGTRDALFGKKGARSYGHLFEMPDELSGSAREMFEQRQAWKANNTGDGGSRSNPNPYKDAGVSEWEREGTALFPKEN